VTFSLDSSIREVDPRVANRRMGMQDKGPPAHRVLADGLGIETVRQLLHHYPRRYIDRTQVARIRDLRVGQQATIIARVRGVTRRRTRRGQSMVTITLWDGSGYLYLTFFNQPWIASSYREGHELAVSGTVTLYGGKLQMAKQEVEVLRAEAETIHTGRITPIHRATEGITTRTIRELVFRALEQLPDIPDSLPQDVVEAEALASYDWALRTIQFPQSQEELARATERLKFDELFVLELGVAFRKHRVAAQEVGVAHPPRGELVERFVAALPFELTTGQRRAVGEITAAMARPHPMNLLLQGDVGSGKTVVALAACLVAVESGHQAAIMAPTEVLAGQHGRNAAILLEPIGAVPYGLVARRTAPAAAGQGSLLAETSPEPGPALTFAMLTAAVTGQERARVVEGVRSGDVDLVVGTHALVQEAVGFRDLSLVVIDEQHRFGVHQRMALKLKGKDASPDVLIMTATPIPRTLALTYYGDLDVAVLDELPAGRQPVETGVVRSAEERRRAYDLVRREVMAGRQAFVVCAAIDEDNRLEVKAAEKEAERLATEVFPDLRVDVLHGRMRPADKEQRMDDFRAGRFDLLISTTVIEVGVDMPNATVMLVENAERFGLAQLHQLRGRIGRGAHRSYCFLFDESAPDNEVARQRLEAMVRSTDGFELADEDLRLRGEGTLFDIRQSGLPDLELARLAEDVDLVRRARSRAFSLIDGDPDLAAHPRLKRELEDRFAESIDWLFHS
jgi:ATP-dependent DNA helicase RecG